MIHKHPTNGEASSSSAAIRYRDWESGLVLPSLEDHEQERLCGLPDIGGHVMKIPLVGFQVLLCMRLEVCFHPDLVSNRKHLFNKQNIGMKLKRTFCLLFEQEPSHCIFLIY